MNISKTQRQQLIDYLQWLDPDGCYRDEDKGRFPKGPLSDDELITYVIYHLTETEWNEHFDSDSNEGFNLSLDTLLDKIKTWKGYDRVMEVMDVLLNTPSLTPNDFKQL